jgi:hypothetical protein
VGSWHIRAKGFPTAAIKYHCEKNQISAGELAQNIFDQKFLNPNENNNGEMIDCLMDGRQAPRRVRRDRQAAPPQLRQRPVPCRGLGQRRGRHTVLFFLGSFTFASSITCSARAAALASCPGI